MHAIVNFIPTYINKLEGFTTESDEYDHHLRLVSENASLKLNKNEKHSYLTLMTKAPIDFRAPIEMEGNL